MNRFNGGGRRSRINAANVNRHNPRRSRSPEMLNNRPRLGDRRSGESRVAFKADNPDRLSSVAPHYSYEDEGDSGTSGRDYSTYEDERYYDTREDVSPGSRGWSGKGFE
jgi:hypothetical protein